MRVSDVSTFHGVGKSLLSADLGGDHCFKAVAL